MPANRPSHGIPRSPNGLPVGERLCRYVEVDPVSGCHIWVGALDRHGYARLWVDGTPQRGHRLAWRERHGPIAPGLVVCHACDERRCINPEHLFLDTQRGNMADYKRKRRLKAERARPRPSGLPADARPHEIAPIHFAWRGFEWRGDAVVRPIPGTAPPEIEPPKTARHRRR